MPLEARRLFTISIGAFAFVFLIWMEIGRARTVSKRRKSSTARLLRRKATPSLTSGRFAIPRRDGRPTMKEHAERDAKAISETIIDWCNDHGYRLEGGIEYGMMVMESALAELTKPSAMKRLYDK